MIVSCLMKEAIAFLLMLVTTGCFSFGCQEIDFAKVGSLRFASVQWSDGVTRTNNYIIDANILKKAFKNGAEIERSKDKMLVYGATDAHMQYGTKQVSVTFINGKINEPIVWVTLGRPISKTFELHGDDAKNFINGIKQENKPGESGSGTK